MSKKLIKVNPDKLPTQAVPDKPGANAIVNGDSPNLNYRYLTGAGWGYGDSQLPATTINGYRGFSTDAILLGLNATVFAQKLDDKDEEEYQKRNNAAIAARGNMVYAGLRFIPYVKYATDVLDGTGLSPDLNNTIDPTDMMGLVGTYPTNLYFNKLADYYDNQQGNKRVRVGRGKHKHYYTRTPAMAKDNARTFRLMSKYNPLQIGALVGDVYQGLQDAVSLYNVEKSLSEYEDYLNSKYAPKITYDEFGNMLDPDGKIIVTNKDSYK